MQSGVIGIPDFDFDPVESYSETKQISSTEELVACLEVERTIDSDGITIQIGNAAIQEIGSDSEVRIDTQTDTIDVAEQEVIKTKHTRFALVPGELVVVGSGDGTFAFDLIASQTDAARIRPARIDLTGLSRSFNSETTDLSASAWQVGFYENSGQAEKGTIYGEDIFDDSEFGKLLEKLPKNQLGITVAKPDETIKMTASEGGYLEVYKPSDYETSDYAKFLLDYVLPHLNVEE